MSDFFEISDHRCCILSGPPCIDPVTARDSHVPLNFTKLVLQMYVARTGRLLHEVWQRLYMRCDNGITCSSMDENEHIIWADISVFLHCPWAHPLLDLGLCRWWIALIPCLFIHGQNMHTSPIQLSNGNILEYFGIFRNTPGYYGIFQIIVIPLYSRVFQNIPECYKIF